MRENIFQVFEEATLKNAKFEPGCGFINQKWRLSAIWRSIPYAYTLVSSPFSQHACASCRKENKWRRVESNRRK
jgi:hypothetical protein